MRRVISDSLISLAALAILLFGLIAIDQTVRERVMSVVETGDVSSSAGALVSTVNQVGRVLLGAAWDQSIDHAPLAVFVVAGSILVLAMLRL